ncbi:MAG: hypothetical protein A2Y62_15420 [Candidatus Fischerbacteria bacterium RBG_13_37_8]|uniref:DUF2007 domain-containing protein n=1 Tax=Candidatus Fischerbacteria bacterium RBG_13_37_8 TaxID=1817863 RepID=A0A1F5VM29_9BACT|nr:MAG: hypothetical protein A2Y62_15420 [Candidatus Fischerbacteria bacterium RBG_13_37_8]
MSEYKEEIIMETYSPWEASLIQNLLQSYDIPSRFVREVPDILPFTIDGLGKIRIAVPSDKAEEAKKLLQDFQSKKETTEEQNNI